MSTKIKSVLTNRTLEVGVAVETPGESAASLTITTAAGVAVDITISRTDLLAAIEAEGIGVVVDGTLPPVTVMSNISVMVDQYQIVSRESREADLKFAFALIAAHRWFDANPPAPEVDEADVEALAEVLDAQGLHRNGSTNTLAHALLASGRVTVTR